MLYSKRNWFSKTSKFLGDKNAIVKFSVFKPTSDQKYINYSRSALSIFRMNILVASSETVSLNANEANIVNKDSVVNTDKYNTSLIFQNDSLHC